MTDLPDRQTVKEALGDWLKRSPTEGDYSTEHVSGVPAIRLAHIHDDGGAEELASLMLDDEGVGRIILFIEAAQAYVNPQITDEMRQRGANALVAHASDPALLRLFAPSVAMRLATEVLEAALGEDTDE